MHFTRKQLVFPTSPLFDAPPRRNALRYQRSLYTLKSAFNWLNSLTMSISIRLAIVGSPNLRNLAKFRENSSLWQIKVIQSLGSWCQSKVHVRLPISYGFRDIDV